MKEFLLGKTLSKFLALAGLALCAAGAQAAPINLVKNGGFDATTNGTGQIGYNTQVNDWTSPGGYNFVFGVGEADTVGAKSWFNQPENPPLTLWGANNGGANALAVSANGGNFLAADGAYGVERIEQMIHGLVVGQKYMLSFEWAAAQQFGFDGDTTENWSVSIDGNTFTTDTYHNANHASSSWMKETFSFTAKGTEGLLSFLAAGTPEGFPPFSLLDGVSLFALGDDGKQGQVPEPATWLTLLTGLLLLAFARRRAARQR